MVVVVGGSLSLLSLCSRHKKAQQMYLIVSGVLVLVLGSLSANPGFADLSKFPSPDCSGSDWSL